MHTLFLIVHSSLPAVGGSQSPFEVAKCLCPVAYFWTNQMSKKKFPNSKFFLTKKYFTWKPTKPFPKSDLIDDLGMTHHFSWWRKKRDKRNWRIDERESFEVDFILTICQIIDYQPIRTAFFIFFYYLSCLLFIIYFLFCKFLIRTAWAWGVGQIFRHQFEYIYSTPILYCPPPCP